MLELYNQSSLKYVFFLSYGLYFFSWFITLCLPGYARFLGFAFLSMMSIIALSFGVVYSLFAPGINPFDLATMSLIIAWVVSVIISTLKILS